MRPATLMTKRATTLLPLKDPAEVPLEPLHSHPRYKAAAAELAVIEERIRSSERRREVALARGRGQSPTTTAIARAEALLKGGSVMVLPPATELEAADEELRVLHAARLAKNEALDALRSELDFEAGKKFEAIAVAAYINADQLADEMHRTLEVPRVICARLIAAGYRVNEAALPVHMFPAAAAVSDPSRTDTPAWRFRQWLVEKGILR